MNLFFQITQNVMFFSCLEYYNSSTIYVNVWIYSDISLLLWTLCFFLVNLSNNLNCMCMYVLYDFWLIPHLVVIWLTYGSMECNIYVCVCMYVCMYVYVPLGRSSLILTEQISVLLIASLGPIAFLPLMLKFSKNVTRNRSHIPSSFLGNFILFSVFTSGCLLFYPFSSS
jgi:hypothetical protein